MTNQVAIAIGLVAGLLLGIVGASGWELAFRLAEGVEPLGTAFIRLIRMVVIPLVAATLFTGVATLADPRKLTRLGGATLAVFWSTSFVAIGIGMLVMRGALVVFPVTVQPTATEDMTQELPTIVDFFLGLIPSNPFEAAADGALLPLIVFAVLFAAAAGTLPDEYKRPLMTLADAITRALITLVHWILWTAPVGVFALAAPVAARSGLAVLQSLAVFIVAVLLALLIFVAAVYLPIVRLLGGMPVATFVRASIGPNVIALSTTSSAATLPAMLEAAAQRMDISRVVAGLVLSLGAAINRAGSALFQGAAVVFLAAFYDVPIPASAVAGAVIATFLVSLTVAGVPSASLVTLAPALETVGVPLAGIAVLFGIDRIPDMARSATNVTGHLATATVIERLSHGGSPGPDRALRADDTTPSPAA